MLEKGLELLLPLIIEAAKQVIDGIVNGAEVTPDAKRAIFSAWVETHVWAARAVASTETPYDNLALEAFWELCLDTLKEAGFELPDVPEF